MIQGAPLRIERVSNWQHNMCALLEVRPGHFQPGQCFSARKGSTGFEDRPRNLPPCLAAGDNIC